MPLFSIATAIRQLTKIKLLIAVLLFSATGLKAQEAVFSGGTELGAFFNSQREYTPEERQAAMDVAGKIPMYVYNNSNIETAITINYTDQWGQPISRKYKPITTGKHIEFFLDPMCTYISFTGTEPNSGKEVYRSTKFVRSKGVKIYLDGTINNIKESVWNW